VNTCMHISAACPPELQSQGATGSRQGRPVSIASSSSSRPLDPWQSSFLSRRAMQSRRAKKHRLSCRMHKRTRLDPANGPTWVAGTTTTACGGWKRAPKRRREDRDDRGGRFGSVSGILQVSWNLEGVFPLYPACPPRPTHLLRLPQNAIVTGLAGSTAAALHRRRFPSQASLPGASVANILTDAPSYSWPSCISTCQPAAPVSGAVHEARASCVL